MTYKSLSVWLDNSKRSEPALDAAVGIAVRFGARLRAVHLRASILPVQAWAMTPEAGIDAEAVDEVARRNDARGAELEAALRGKATAAGLAAFDWRSTERTSPTDVMVDARYADLCVMAQSSRQESLLSYPSTFPGSIALGSGRPLLVLPPTGQFDVAGRHVLIGWNGSREAARAAADALPFLHDAEQVTVLIGDSAPSREAAGGSAAADIEAYFGCHGIRVQVEQRELGDASASDLLLTRAADLGADLLVIGAYGHSRFRELVLGGVSRDLLQRMALPVLMSH